MRSKQRDHEIHPLMRDNHLRQLILLAHMLTWYSFKTNVGNRQAKGKALREIWFLTQLITDKQERNDLISCDHHLGQLIY